MLDNKLLMCYSIIVFNQRGASMAFPASPQGFGHFSTSPNSSIFNTCVTAENTALKVLCFQHLHKNGGSPHILLTNSSSLLRRLP